MTKKNMAGTVYLDVTVEFETLGSRTEVTPFDAVWHSRYPLLAIGYAKSENGLVRIIEYSLENDTIHPLEDYEHESAQPCCLSWHPSERCLVAGWENGEVTIWTPIGGTIVQTVQHQYPVSQIEWSACTPVRLVTADTAGSCLGWQLQDNVGEQLFYHEIRETLVDIVFRPNAKDFFVATESGTLFIVTDTGQCHDLLRVDGHVIRLLYNSNSNTLVTVTDNLVISQFRHTEQNGVDQVSRVKLAGSGYRARIEWLMMGVLVIAAGDTSLRLVNLRTNDNANLHVSSENSNESFTALAVDTGSQKVAAGTTHGRIFIWNEPSTAEEAEERNANPYEVQVTGNFRTLGVCSAFGLISAVAQEVTVFREQQASLAYSSQLLALQTGARKAFIDLIQMSVSVKLETEVPIRALFAGREVVGVSDRKRLLFYELQHATRTARFLGSMNTTSVLISLHDQNAFVIQNGQIEVRSFQGALNQTIVAQQDEGEIVSIDVAGFFIAVGSSKGCIRMWDVGNRREITSHAGPKSLLIPERSKLHSVRCNANGTKISAIMSSVGGDHTLPLLYVWDIEEDDVFCLDFSRPSKEGDRNRMYTDMSGKVPVNHLWDGEDPRLLVLECHFEDSNTGSSEAVIVTVFVTAEFGLVVQDTVAFDKKKFSLIGAHVPYFYLVSKNGSSERMGPEKLAYAKHAYRLSMSDFVGVESCDRETREAILKLSFFLTTGNMDEAFSAIRSIKSESVWENMARMCVKNKRLDVAPVCLGKMKKVSAAMALRQVQAKHPENIDLQVSTAYILFNT